MNIYNCWCRGNYGYCCRTWGKKWMFVPELDQFDNKICKDLSLDDLVFDNKHEKKYEMEYERRLSSFHLIRFTKLLAVSDHKQKTVVGELLSNC